MADTCIALRTKMTDIYIVRSYWAADEMGIVAVWFCLIKCFQVHASFTWKQGGICWQPKMSILWSCQNVKRTSPSCSSCRDGQKTYMERLIQSPDEEVMPLERCLVVGSSDPSRDFRLSEVPTGVGTSEKPEEIYSDVWGYPYVGSSDKSWKFRLSGVPTQVETSDISDRKSCSDLAFWIPIRLFQTRGKLKK